MPTILRYSVICDMARTCRQSSCLGMGMATYLSINCSCLGSAGVVFMFTCEGAVSRAIGAFAVQFFLLVFSLWCLRNRLAQDSRLLHDDMR